MSRLPRGPATAGTIRPPASGLTLPRGLGSKDFLNDVPEMPALTQRIQPGSRRATLTAATFSPPIEGNATIARSSGFAATPGSGVGRAASPSPGMPRELHSTVTLRTPPLPAAAASSKDMSATLARARARSPAHSFGTLQSTPGHDVPKGLALSRGGHPLPRNGDGVSLTQRLGSGAAQLPTIPSTLSNTGLVGTIASTLMAAPRPSSAAGLRCGDPVFIPLQNLRGTLRFLGPIDGKQGTWAGVELDEVGKGKNDGSVAGKSYFVCPPNTGIFAAPSKVEPCVDQRTLATDTGNRPVSSASSIHYAPETDKPAHAVSRPGSTGRLGHSTPVSGGYQRAQSKPPGRSRFASDAQSPASIGMSTINTPASSAQNRRKTMSRIAPLEQTPGQPRPRPPPTISRGANRARPISTAESVASNHTTSPQLSRPSSRSVASSIGDLAATVASPSRQPALVRPHATGGVATLDILPSASVQRRPAAAMPARPPEVAGRAANHASKPRITTTTDPAERLRLRIDMLEAENRVLRLKGEQDKAHLAASHMLARDLATVNGTVSPQLRGGIEGAPRASPHNSGMSAAMPEATDPNGISRQLGEARDQLERERQESKSQIALLVAQIGELKLHCDSTSSKGANVESEGACVDEALDATRASAGVAEFEAKLDVATQAHAKELLAAKELQAELVQELDIRTAANKALLADLEAKTGEAASLSQRLKQADAERLRANQMFKDLVEEHEQKADDSSEKSELVSKLGSQVEKLRQEFLESEEQRLNLASGLEVAQGRLSASETKLAATLAGVAQLEERSDGYDDKCALLSLYHSHMCQAVELAQQHASRAGVVVADEHLPVAYSTEAVSELHSKFQAAVVLLADTARADSQILPDSTADRGSVDTNLKARIEELEEFNDRLAKERDQITLQQTLVNDYLEKLESECNRLVEDIEQLTSENQKLSEDLRMASLQNSTISLDMGALDAKLAGEHAESGGAQPNSASHVRDSPGDGDDDDSASLQNRHARELAAVQDQLAEIQQRKDKEIKRLQDELGSLEDLVEDKIFSESELNDKITSLTGEVERLRRDLQRAQGSSGAVTTAISDRKGADSKPTGPAANRMARTEEASDDEPTYCDICDARTHETACCPQLQATSSTIFKQDVAIDSSRPYCDNCEAFAGHWTDECPHGDEMF
ncbi:hypothetical protein GGI19_002271 [Coemansia pectinata]|uniref:CAP-Gly domain-containing protein n=1 Tax=Coemansia pectinata TaxID=1052879 RepID=A0A9W8H003_9FUNG|nr:hypothetical protein GGI19_002271 [Coemansia pectinata]